MKTDDSITMRTGQNSADIVNLRTADDRLDERVEALENAKAIQDLAIAKCTAIWGFIVIIFTGIGGIVSYNFIKVKLAIIAAFRVFNGS